MKQNVSYATKRPLISVIALAVIVVFLLTGCRMEADLKVGEDGNGTVVMTVAMTKEELSIPELDELGQDINCDLITQLMNEESSDIDLQFKEKGDEPGLVCVSDPVPVTADDMGYKFTEKKGKYVFEMKGGDGVAEEFAQLENDDEFDIDFDIKMTIEMPGKVVSTTTGKKKGNKVILSEPADFDKDIVIEAKSSNAVIPIVISVVVLLVVIAVVLIIVVTRKKKDTAPQQQQWQQPPQQWGNQPPQNQQWGNQPPRGPQPPQQWNPPQGRPPQGPPPQQWNPPQGRPPQGPPPQQWNPPQGRPPQGPPPQGQPPKSE